MHMRENNLAEQIYEGNIPFLRLSDSISHQTAFRVIELVGDGGGIKVGDHRILGVAPLIMMQICVLFSSPFRLEARWENFQCFPLFH